jgi:hypothetical protein
MRVPISGDDDDDDDDPLDAIEGAIGRLLVFLALVAKDPFEVFCTRIAT